MSMSTVGNGRANRGRSAWGGRAQGAVLPEGGYRSVFEVQRRPVDPLPRPQKVPPFPPNLQPTDPFKRFWLHAPPLGRLPIPIAARVLRRFSPTHF
jgi:hypothetical protein